MKQLLLSICVVFSLCQPALAQQEDDRSFLTRTIEDALSGAGRDVRLEGFIGALSSEASFTSLSISDDQGVWLFLEDVTLNWRRAALLRGRLEVTELSAQLIDLRRLPVATDDGLDIPEAEAKGFSLPELPVSINIAKLNVTEFRLGETILGEAFVLAMEARARLDSDGLDAAIKASRTDGQAGQFDVSTLFQRDTSEMSIDLTLDEAPQGLVARLLAIPGQPSVLLRVQGAGQLDDFAADISLATDATERLRGQISLKADASTVPQDDTQDSAAAEITRRITATVAGDIATLVAPAYQDFVGSDVGLDVLAVLPSDGTISVEAFDLRARALQLSGRVDLNQDRWPVLIDVNGRMGDPDGAPVLLPGGNGETALRNATLAVMYDAANGEALRGAFDIAEFSAPGMVLDQVSLNVDGTLQGELGSVGQFLADVDVQARGVNLNDPAMSRAVGDDLTAKAQVNYIEGQPVRLSGVRVSGEGLGLDGWMIVGALADGFPARFSLALQASGLERFADLAQRPISGAALVQVAGRAAPLAGTFDVQIAGQTVDLGVGLPEADRLLQGETDLVLAARRDETGTFVDRLTLDNSALDLSASAVLQGGKSRVEAVAGLRDIGLIAPQYQGAARVSAQATQDVRGWTVSADATGPYGSAATIAGLATGPQADMTITLRAPDVTPFVPTLSGALDAKARVRQTLPGWEVEVAASGPYGATVAFRGLATGPSAELRYLASLPNVAVFVPQVQGRLALDGMVRRQGDNWAVETKLEGPAGTTADISGTVSGDGQTLAMKAIGNAPLGLSGPFIAPRLLQGQADFDLAINGKPSLASLSGRITTSGASLSAPNLRVALINLAANVNLSDSRADIQSQADVSTGGTIRVDGGIALSTLAASLQVALQNAVVVDPRLYQSLVNARLSIDGPLTGGAKVSGRVDIGETYVTVPASGLTAIGDIPPITHVGSSQAASETRARADISDGSEKDGTAGTSSSPFGLDIQINAPSKIYIRGRGLDAEVGGALNLSGTTRQVISSGQFSLIRGRLNLLGQRFDLVSGTTEFQGGLTPYIRFVTNTKTSNGTASIVIEGPADEPEVTFMSDPAAPQDEVISQILFGRELSQISAFQALQLADAVASLAGRSGQGVIAGLRDGFGFDNLDISTGDDGQTQVTVGKYISDNLYTDFTAGSDGVGEVSLNLDISPSLTAKGTAGSDGNSGIGLFFEKDY